MDGKQAGGALQGLRVIELAAIGPVPMAGMLLADQGADVVRVDRLVDSGLGLRLAPRLDVHARGRRSVALDLKSDAGRAVLWRLLDRADVLLEGFRPGVLEALGLAPAALLARCPRLVIGRMTGYGQTGPLAQAAGHDLNYLALTGLLQAIGPAEGPPVPPLNLVGDYGGGALFLAFGVMAALFERQRSGCGQVVDAAMVDGVAAMAGLFHGLRAGGDWHTERASNLLDGGAPFYACYETADGRYLAVAALEARFFAELARRIGLDEAWVGAQHDRSRWPALRAALAGIFLTRSRDEWCTLLAGTDTCVAPVLSLDEAPEHPHAQARGAYRHVDGVAQPAAAPRFSRSRPVPPRPAPEPGAHTHDILKEAGMNDADIEALIRSGAAR
jgi:alpha-methylacyl-CoA racemase